MSPFLKPRHAGRRGRPGRERKLVLGIARDTTKREKTGQEVKEVRDCAEAIINAVSDPLLVLDKHLRVSLANKAFYQFFKSDKNETIGKLVYNLGNGQWNIPKLKRLLNNILPEKNQIRGFEVTHRFKNIGLKTMLLNSKQIIWGDNKVILLAIEDITERKKVAGLLSASETKYHRLFESARDGILVIDAETGMIIDVNPFLTQLLGFSEKEFCAKKIWDVGLFKDVAANKTQFLRLQKKGHVRYENLPLKTAKGEQVNVEFVGNVYNVDNQKVIQYNIRDITERKKEENALKESERNFRVIFDNANDGILLADVKTKIFYTGNNTICQMLGYSLEEIKKLGVLDVHPKEDLPYVIGQFERQVSREIEVAKDIPVKRKDSSVFYADVNTSLVTLAGRKYLLGVFRDITERRKDEEKINRAAKEWEKTFNSITDLVYILDTNFRILKANRAFAEFLKMKPEEITGRKCFELVHKTKKPIAGCPLVKTLKSNKSFMEEIYDPNSGLSLMVSTSPVFEDDGKIGSIVHIAKDITEMKRVETEMKKNNEELERFGSLAVGRELKMIELKKRINELEAEVKERA